LSSPLLGGVDGCAAVSGVLIVDDHPLMAQGLSAVLSAEDDFVVLGVAYTAVEAIGLVQSLLPAIVIMDLHLPDMHGGIATRRILELVDTRVLAFTSFGDEGSLEAAIDGGVSGFLLKTSRRETVLQALRAVVAGECFIDTRMVEPLLTSFRGRSPAVSEPGIEQLTSQETIVLRLIGEGLSNKEIASRLYIAEATVKAHVNRIFRKLGVSERPKAMVIAQRTLLR